MTDVELKTSTSHSDSTVSTPVITIETYLQTAEKDIMRTECGIRSFPRFCQKFSCSMVS